MSKVTKNEIDYKAASYGFVAKIPKGTPVIPADNLPSDTYWVEAWEGMDEKEESWMRNYGFNLSPEEVKEIT